MEKDYWLKAWENKHINFHQSETNEGLMEFFNLLDLKKGDTVFVPLCGKSLDMLWIAEQGLKVIGVEVSQLAIEEFFKENKVDYRILKNEKFDIYESQNVTIYHGDFFDLSPDDFKNVHAVYDRASMVALPIDLREKYCSKIQKLIKEFKYLLVTFEYPPERMEGPPFSIKMDEIYKNFKDSKITILKESLLKRFHPKIKDPNSIDIRRYSLISKNLQG